MDIVQIRRLSNRLLSSNCRPGGESVSDECDIGVRPKCIAAASAEVHRPAIQGGGEQTHFAKRALKPWIWVARRTPLC